MRFGLLLDLVVILRLDGSTEVGLTRLSDMRYTGIRSTSSRITSSMLREVAILFLVLERTRQDLGVGCCDLGDERPSEGTLSEVFYAVNVVFLSNSNYFSAFLVSSTSSFFISASACFSARVLLLLMTYGLILYSSQSLLRISASCLISIYIIASLFFSMAVSFCLLALFNFSSAIIKL